MCVIPCKKGVREHKCKIWRLVNLEEVGKFEPVPDALSGAIYAQSRASCFCTRRSTRPYNSSLVHLLGC
jgi:hypothetical protein